MILSAELLRQATGCTAEAAARFAEPLRAACAFYGLDTPARLAAFLAQIGHESGSLRYTSEVWGPTPAQLTYEGRANLGNTQPGDGARFKGHGLIQTTGRYNHARVRDRLRARFPDVPDFEADPEALCDPQWAALSAADYWDDRGCNALADAGDFIAITRKVNGGLNGLSDRQERLARARAALLPTPQPAPDRHAAPDPGPPRPIPRTTESPKEPAMPLPTLLWGLASSLIDVFTPLAREKITKEIGRHTDDATVRDQVANNVIETAKALTGKTDPIEAVVAAKAEPEIVQQVEAGALETIDRLAPILDKMAGWESQAWTAEESSREAAAARARAEANDLAPMLATWAVKGLVGMIVVLALLVVAQIVWSPDHKPSGELVTALTGLMMMFAGKANTVYDYRFGSSRSSGAKDVVIGELSRRKP